MRVRAGISELYASLMLLIIISTMGTIVYSYTVETASRYEQHFVENNERESKRILEHLNIASVWWSHYNDDLNITIFNYGIYDTAVVEIYVNNIIVSKYYDGLNDTIESLNLKEVSFESPIPIIKGDQYTIIIVSKKGVTNSHMWRN